jgi:sulfite reductase (NADPH) flavoprotein alpha-component
MILPANPLPAIFLPENAPFTPEQRSWLNGFFAGLIALDSAAALPLPNIAPGEQDDGEAPWHDQTIPLPERMKLRKVGLCGVRMAAMAQQDCGQCGYNCSDYADVLSQRRGAFLGVPGGKETARC